MKILGTFAIMVFLLIAGSGITYFQLNQIGNEMDSYAEFSERSIVVTDVASLVRSKYIMVSDYYRTGDTNDTAFFEEQSDLLNTYLESLDGRMYSEESQQLFSSVQSQIASFDEHITRIPEDSGPLQQQRLTELAELRHEIVQDSCC
ncbi:hypothetical protein [Salipaludibacillus keqinensis]|uniref:hypothetical protein n=1 Tax=Salipaludibacillus keqinensis TaxID=2045207 RepID=UPI001E436429|nr:hypothetical protein [Salipaludibacillus keqinensis]